jgi:hypothetical protein
MSSKLLERLKYFFFEVQNDWEIGYSNSSIDSFLEKKTPKMKWLKMPKDVFWADPFGIHLNNKYYVFYEEFNKIKGYGTINCLILNSEFAIIENKVIIDEDIHFSFPFVFQFQNEYYMLPETCQKKEIALYKATNFPFEWKKEKVLLNLPGMDNVIFFQENKWWLIYSLANSECASWFYLRSLNDLFSDWNQTKENIVKGTMYNTRAGGSVFQNKGDLYRVTQNCTDYYGQSVVINKITALSEINFKEEAVKEIMSDSALHTGFHTISKCGAISLVDRRRERLFFKSFSSILKSIFSKFITF